MNETVSCYVVVNIHILLQPFLSSVNFVAFHSIVAYTKSAMATEWKLRYRRIQIFC